ncbi:hypothetical protein BHE74_00035550 [Ensete ventricosum]|nr:hypothetical protein BHE74_00035550 [Ensete ventricosum]
MPSPSYTALLVQASATNETEHPSKKTKVLVRKAPSDIAPPFPTMTVTHKGTPIVCDSGRVVDELSEIIDELRAEVRKLKEEADPVAVAIVEARVNKVSTPRGAQVLAWGVSTLREGGRRANPNPGGSAPRFGG